MAGLVPAIHVLHDPSMSGGYVYILASAPNGILYVGVTSDLVRRIYEQRSGLVPGFTKRYSIKRLVYFVDREDSCFQVGLSSGQGKSAARIWCNKRLSQRRRRRKL
jgi:GIY-YIG catalytic domain